MEQKYRFTLYLSSPRGLKYLLTMFQNRYETNYVWMVRFFVLMFRLVWLLRYIIFDSSLRVYGGGEDHFQFQFQRPQKTSFVQVQWTGKLTQISADVLEGIFKRNGTPYRVERLDDAEDN